MLAIRYAVPDPRVQDSDATMLRPPATQIAASARKEREEKEKLAKELFDLKQAAREATDRERVAKERLEKELADLKHKTQMDSETERLAREQREHELAAEKDRLEKVLEMERSSLYAEIERVKANAGSVYVTGGGGTDSSPQQKSVRWSASLEETKFYVKGSSMRKKGDKDAIKSAGGAAAPPVPAPRSAVSQHRSDIEPPTQKQKQKGWFNFGRSRNVDVEAGEADVTLRQLPAVPMAESRAALLNMWQDEGNDEDEGLYAEVGPALDDDFEGLYETLDDARDYEDVDGVEVPEGEEEDDAGENDYEVPVVLQLANTTGESSADGDAGDYDLPTPLPSPRPVGGIALPGMSGGMFPFNIEAGQARLDGSLASPVPPPRQTYALDAGDAGGGGGDDDHDVEA